MLYGLGSALGYGFGDLCGAISTRRIGVPMTLFVIQLIDTVLLSLLMLTPLPGELSAGGAAWAAIVAAGILGTLSYLSFFRALQLGPVAVVSPVFASSAAVSVLLAVLFNGERLSAMASAGVVLTIAGVALASAQGEGHRGEGPRSWGGIPYALVATVSWGVAGYLLGRYSQETGWYLPTFGSRVVEFLMMGIVLLVLASRRVPLPVPRGRTIVFPIGSAVADATGVAMFARGSQVGLVSITAAVSATFPLVVIAGGVVLFHERPTPIQWLGVMTAIIGLVLLGLGR
jgi:drug/metabolite transporter (DMT)-like permease